ncbi:MAG TPA: hypothetical protein VK348_15080, partial [Planctomycetota bacterium]|nr:hypothetical protein [Planctomycetota bacterium]
LVLCDGRSTVVLRHAGGMVTESDWREPVLVVSNEHAPGRLRLPGLPDAAALPRDARELLQCLRPLLLDEGGAGRHPVLKRGDLYGTVSSSLLAVPPAGMPQRLLWLYASGAPDVTPYRDYGNLGKRLLPVDDGALG